MLTRIKKALLKFRERAARGTLRYIALVPVPLHVSFQRDVEEVTVLRSQVVAQFGSVAHDGFGRGPLVDILDLKVERVESELKKARDETPPEQKEKLQAKRVVED